ncbi:unnamed protein product [Penicillium olsonii]|nr:unnamed protein product [Penicillium olsonii]
MDLSDSDSESDSDEQGLQFRSKKLQQAGSWYKYVKEFQIFIPFLLPRGNRTVQSCICVVLVCLTFNRALHVLVPHLLGLAVDQVSSNEEPLQALGLWMLFEVFNSESGLGYVEELAKIPLKQFSYRQITNAAFDHVMQLSMEFHSTCDSAEVMKAIEQGESLTGLLETIIVFVAPTFIDLVIACVYLGMRFNIFASLAMAVASVSYISLEVWLSTWNFENRRALTKAKREETRVMHQAVQGWKTVALFSAFSHERARFGRLVDSQLLANKKWSQRDALLKATLGLMVPFTFLVLCCLILRDVSRGTASVGDFIFFTKYWETLINPLTFLSQHYRWLTSDLIDAEHLLELLQTQPTVTDKETAQPSVIEKGEVKFQDVHFAYPSRSNTVEGVSITARPGQTVALVGETGAGKSSIMKLLRFYDINSGSIKIDGQDIRDVTLKSLRETIGVVPQDPLLFNASILENLRYANHSASDEEIYEACKLAAIHSKILCFPKQYDTSVGEQGVKLSGGELQRLAIARVILKNPPIVILDEATSAVDTNTETAIQASLAHLQSKRTTFVIAHRLSTIINADEVPVMRQGRVVERGTHGQLLEKQGMYHSLWTSQANGREETS